MNFVKSLCILNNLNFNLNHWSTCITTGPVMSVWLPLCVQLLTDSLLFLLNYIGLNFSPKIIFRPKLLERIFKYPVKVSVANLWNFINNFKMLTVKRTDLIQISTHLSLVIEPARLVIFSIVSVWEASLWSIESADLMRLSPIYRSWPPIHPYCWRWALAVQQKICYSDWQQKKAKCSFIVVFYFP